MQSIREELFRHQDNGYGDFTFRSLTTVKREAIIGVRVPQLRRIAREMEKSGDAASFLDQLPHGYYEENLIHSILLAKMKNPQECLNRMEVFLPYMDNWAVCDTLVPRCFEQKPELLMAFIPEWNASDQCFICRFGIGMLMHFFLGKHYSSEILELPLLASSEEYYVKMMVAWFYATALVDHWEETLPYLTVGRLPEWIRRKAIQKGIESYRISPEHKEYLRSLR